MSKHSKLWEQCSSNMFDYLSEPGNHASFVCLYLNLVVKHRMASLTQSEEQFDKLMKYLDKNFSSLKQTDITSLISSLSLTK
jgi:hypothetical protein